MNGGLADLIRLGCIVVRMAEKQSFMSAEVNSDFSRDGYLYDPVTSQNGR
jgi:hypothetical protein